MKVHDGNVAAPFGGAGHFAGVLAEDAGPIRPLAGPQENPESAAVPPCSESPTAGIRSSEDVDQTECAVSCDQTCGWTYNSSQLQRLKPIFERIVMAWLKPGPTKANQ